MAAVPADVPAALAAARNGLRVILTEARAIASLNPGGGGVPRLTHEPRVSVAVKDLESGESRSIHAAYFLDATEQGDLLPLTRTEYVSGFESRKQTGEPHAPAEAQPKNIPSYTCCFAIEHRPGEDHTIDKPEEYSFWRDYKRNFIPAAYPSDITLVNWPQNDYWLGNIQDVSEEDAARHLKSTKQLSLSLLYWMQKAIAAQARYRLRKVFQARIQAQSVEIQWPKLTAR